MADFDAHQAQQQAHQNQFDHDQARIAFLEQNVANMSTTLLNIQNAQNNVPTPVPQHIIHPNLNLQPPPSFSGSPLHLPTFKMKLIHFLVGNRNKYPDSESQLLYAGQLLEGPSYQWYQSIVDPNTFQLHHTYDLHRFFQELEDFFGGAVTLHSRERSLDLLRQTGTVSDLACAFQTITHSFSPRWPDHPLIFFLAS